VKTTLFRAAAVSAYLLSVTTWAQQDRPTTQDPVDPHHGETKAKGDKRTDPGTTGTGDMSKLGSVDKTFVLDAAIGGLAEVEMGKLAQQNGQSQGVKDYGERLVTDHEKANRDLERVVAAYGVTLPTKVDEEHQKHLDMLKAKKGAEFDAVFIKHMVDDHQKMINKFTKQAKSGTAAPIKEFATATLPTLQEHLKIAKDLQKTKTSAR
jgi:putative membrane protein